MANSRKIAFCGVTGALSITILLFGFLMPFSTYACPAIAACLLLPIVYEYKEKIAFTLYLAVSFLSLFLIPDKELSMMYILVFGLYTVFKFLVDKIKPRFLKVFVKILYSVASTSVCYLLLLIIFPIPILVDDFKGMTSLFIFLLLALFVVTFLLYDFALSKLLLVYKYKLRPKLFKH